MKKATHFWQTLAVSAALALAVPAFAQSQNLTPDPSDPLATSPSSADTMQAPQGEETARGDIAATQADRVLNQRIREALSSDSTLAAATSTLHLESDNGEVTLQGSVASDEQKSAIVNMIAQVSGVKEVHDQLKVGV